MANPNGTVYLTANAGYVWTQGDVYEIVQQDNQEGAATGASFGGLGVDNQPHQVLLNKIQWLYNKLSAIVPHGQTLLELGSGVFIVPAGVTALWIRGWGVGGNGGGSVSGRLFGGGGGGGGGYFEGVMTVTPAQHINWVINPSISQFGTWYGQAGGRGQNGTSSAWGASGAGGGASAPIQLVGTSGELGRTVSEPGGAVWLVSGEGGSAFGCGHSHFGWLGAGIAAAGANGIYPGQGGGGGVNGGSGGIGCQGLIIVQW